MELSISNGNVNLHPCSLKKQQLLVDMFKGIGLDKNTGRTGYFQFCCSSGILLPKLKVEPPIC